LLGRLGSEVSCLSSMKRILQNRERNSCSTPCCSSTGGYGTSRCDL